MSRLCSYSGCRSKRRRFSGSLSAAGLENLHPQIGQVIRELNMYTYPEGLHDFACLDLAEHMILLHRHIGFKAGSTILVNSRVFGVMEYFINLVIAGGVFAVFVSDIPRRVTNGKAGK